MGRQMFDGALPGATRKAGPGEESLVRGYGLLGQILPDQTQSTMHICSSRHHVDARVVWLNHMATANMALGNVMHDVTTTKLL